MDNLAIYQHKYKVGISDADFTQTLKISTLFGYFQEIACMHSSKLGLGIEEISEKYGVTWVLVKIKVEIDRLPAWNEEIIVETIAHNPKKVEVERDYIVKDLDEKIIIRAVSSWIVLDINTRELKKMDTIPFPNIDFTEERPMESKLGKIKPFGDPESAYKKKIGYSDIDINGHLNNSKYVDFIMDCFPFDSHKRYKVKTIQVNFINEAMPEDYITFNKDTSNVDSNLMYIEGINSNTGKQVFNAQIEIEQR